jgi:hypothetical protein
MRKVRVKAATSVDIAIPENCNGKVVVQLKKGTGETVTISSVKNLYKHMDGTESESAALTAVSTPVAGLAIEHSINSALIRVALSGAPASAASEIEVLAFG